MNYGHRMLCFLGKGGKPNKIKLEKLFTYLECRGGSKKTYKRIKGRDRFMNEIHV